MLLILAGVALATLTGQGNIIGNAENAVGKYNNSVAGEQQLLNEIEKYFKNYLEGGNRGTTPSTPELTGPVDENGLATENVTIITNEENVQIVIPAGFAPVILTGSNSTYSLPGQDGSVKEIMPYEQWSSITAEQINQGIVIVDHAITYTGTTPNFNEYVWVPIPNFEENFKRTAWTTWTGTANLANKLTEGAFWEDTTTQEYKDMEASISHYKGFYIGRYEGSEGRGSVAQSKRNQFVMWFNLTQLKAIEACKKSSIENMHLIYGIEWDSTLNWLLENAVIISGTNKKMELEDLEIDSSSWGNYMEGTFANITNTGNNESWKANNIYDLAGNIEEWTQERYSNANQIVLRGGLGMNEGIYEPVAERQFMEEDETNINCGFRASFFISL